MPSVGLHQALKGNLLQEALLEHQLFSQLEFVRDVPANLQKVLETERTAQEEAESLKVELEEGQLAHQKLREESIQAALEAEQQHESSRTEIESPRLRLAFLESEAYQVDVVEQYCNSPLCKVEVALAYKPGFDYFLEQIPRESRPKPDSLYYPSRVASCLDALKEIERKGGGLVLDVDNGDEGGEELEGGSARDSWAS